MAQIDEKQIEEIVSQVLRTLQQDAPGTGAAYGIRRCELFPVRGLLNSIRGYRSRENRTSSIGQTWVCQKTRNHRSDQRGLACECERLADLAVQDTNMGNAAHKVMKNEGAVTLSPGVDDLISEAIYG